MQITKIMKQVLRYLALGLVVVGTALGSLGPAQAALAAGACTVSSADRTMDSEEQTMLQLINAYRQQHGLVPLKVSRTLDAAAPWLARDMATYSYFSHTDRLGRSPDRRLTDCGYPAYPAGGSGSAGWAENIAAGAATAASTFTQWQHSPVHNANMLKADARVAGIGRAYQAASRYGWYWTLDVGTKDDSGFLVINWRDVVNQSLIARLPALL